jgi:hypothetical protein
VNRTVKGFSVNVWVEVPSHVGESDCPIRQAAVKAHCGEGIVPHRPASANLTNPMKTSYNTEPGLPYSEVAILSGASLPA